MPFPHTRNPFRVTDAILPTSAVHLTSHTQLATVDWLAMPKRSDLTTAMGFILVDTTHHTLQVTKYHSNAMQSNVQGLCPTCGIN